MNIWSINRMNATLLQLQFWIRFENRQNESNSIRLKISNFTAINPNWNWRCRQRPGQKNSNMRVIDCSTNMDRREYSSHMSNDRPNTFEQLRPFICISILLRIFFWNGYLHYYKKGVGSLFQKNYHTAHFQG